MLIDGSVTSPVTQTSQSPDTRSPAQTEQMQHRPVSDTIAGRWIRGIQQRLNFLNGRDRAPEARTGFS